MTDPSYKTAPTPVNRPRRLLLFGLGYTGRAIAALAAAEGYTVAATSRTPERLCPPQGVTLIRFEDAGQALAHTSHVLQTAPPEADGDPVLARFGPALANLASLRWAGLLSTTGVYGDRGGAWVDEDTPPAPTGPRGRRRLAVEQEWTATFAGRAVDLFRLAGIYGPGRSVLDEVRAGRARRIDKPDHRFGRTHRDDIARAVVAAMGQDRGPGRRVLNLTDDEPAASAAVIEEAARLLGRDLPPRVSFEDAVATMSPMGRSFWAENRQVASARTKAALGLAWRYPTYREGLRAILEQERAEGVAEQSQV